MIDIKTLKMGQRVYFSHHSHFRIYCGEVYHVSLYDMRSLLKLSELECDDKYGFVLVNSYDVSSEMKLENEFVLKPCHSCFNSISDCVNKDIKVYIAYTIESIRLRIEAYEKIISKNPTHHKKVDWYKNMILEANEHISKYEKASLEVDELYGVGGFTYVSKG